MKHLITFTDDISLLKAELEAKGLYDAEINSYNAGMAYTPIKYNGLKSLSVSRIYPTYSTDADGNQATEYLSPFDNLEILGEYDEIFADALLDAKYKSVWDYTLMDSYTDEDGTVIEVPRNKYVGGFA